MDICSDEELPLEFILYIKLDLFYMLRQMGKLIELYYEHKLDLLKRDMRGNGATEREIELADIEKVEEDELEKNLNKLSDLKPFIKWLVENDKIDFELDRIIHKHKGIDYNTGKGIAVEKLCDKYETLLMLLSISDTPIDDLISYLK